MTSKTNASERNEGAAVVAESAAEWVDIDSLKPWKHNPRKDQPVDDVAKSIEMFGFARPIVARRANREIIAGHTAWKAAKKLGQKRVPTRFLDLDEKRAHELALADNRLGELAQWDEKTLARVMSDIDDDARALLDSSGIGDSAREPIEVQEVDVSEATEATFWMTVRGPLPAQPDVIEKLRAALERLPGVTVELGGMA